MSEHERERFKQRWSEVDAVLRWALEALSDPASTLASYELTDDEKREAALQILSDLTAFQARLSEILAQPLELRVGDDVIPTTMGSAAAAIQALLSLRHQGGPIVIRGTGPAGPFALPLGYMGTIGIGAFSVSPPEGGVSALTEDVADMTAEDEGTIGTGGF